MLLNRDRARAGLPPLALDATLAEVARAHSADMVAHGFFGHISPSHGSAADRVRRAGIAAALVLENLARAYAPGEAEQALMNSPGHRANILHRGATRVGVGIVTSEAGGVRQLFVTQLFIRPPTPLAKDTAAEVRRALAELRGAHHLSAFASDSGLDKLAQATAADIARGTLDSDAGGKRVAAALQSDAHRWKSASTLFAVVISPEQIIDSLERALVDPRFTHLGIGLAPGRRHDGQMGTYVVLVLAVARP
jgi:uncharacterized protein YkwD